MNNFDTHNLKRLMDMKIKSIKKEQENIRKNNKIVDESDRDINEYEFTFDSDYRYDQDDGSVDLLEKDDTSLVDLSQFIERSYTSFSPMRKHTPYFFGVYDPNATIRYKYSSSFDSLSISTLEDDDLESDSSDILHITYPFQKGGNDDSSDYDMLYDNLCDSNSNGNNRSTCNKKKIKERRKQKRSNKKSKSEPQLPNSKKNDSNDIWNVEESDERKRVLEFWLSLSQEERNKLIKLEKESVTKKMKEQQRHSCTCSVCGRRRALIEEELELLYDAYYEELERYTNHNGDLSDHELFKNIGTSNNMLNIADDLMKNEGKKFVQMMERLADRKIRKDVSDDHSESDNDDTNERLEKAKSMFQLFAAKMFEQRILTAYREKVALEKQMKLIEEEEEKDKLAQQKKVSRQRKRDRKKMKKKQKQMEEERKKREEEERLKKEQEEKLKKKEEEQKKLELDKVKQNQDKPQEKPEQQKKEEEKTTSKKKKRKNKGKTQQTQVVVPLEPPKEPSTSIVTKNKSNSNDKSNNNNNITNDSNNTTKQKPTENNPKSTPINNNIANKIENVNKQQSTENETTKHDLNIKVNDNNNTQIKNNPKNINTTNMTKKVKNEVPNTRTKTPQTFTHPKDTIYISPGKPEPTEFNQQRIEKINFEPLKSEELYYKPKQTIISQDDEVVIAPRRDEIEVHKKAVIAFEKIRKYLIGLKHFNPILARDIWDNMISIDVTLEYSGNNFNPVNFLIERCKKGYAYIDLHYNSPGLYSSNPDISCLNNFSLSFTTKKQPCLVCDNNPGVELMTPCNHLVCESCLSSYKSSLQPIGQQPMNIEIKHCIVCKKSINSKFPTSSYNLYKSQYFPSENNGNQYSRLYNPFDEKPNYQNNFNSFMIPNNTHPKINNFWNHQNTSTTIKNPMLHLLYFDDINNYNTPYSDNSMYPINIIPKIQ